MEIGIPPAETKGEIMTEEVPTKEQSPAEGIVAELRNLRDEGVFDDETYLKLFDMVIDYGLAEWFLGYDKVIPAALVS